MLTFGVALVAEIFPEGDLIEFGVLVDGAGRRPLERYEGHRARSSGNEVPHAAPSLLAGDICDRIAAAYTSGMVKLAHRHEIETASAYLK